MEWQRDKDMDVRKENSINKGNVITNCLTNVIFRKPSF